MAFMHGEDGKTVVAAALAGRAVISVANWAEVLSKVAEAGGDPIALEIASKFFASGEATPGL
jgi:PIN domain nuclease of toxin-antitoxin system